MNTYYFKLNNILHVILNKCKAKSVISSNYIFLFCCYCMFYLCLPNLVYGQSSYTFKLDKAAKTSAGVYTNDGVLIKTLWTNVDYSSAGTYPLYWDGKDNSDNEVAKGNYVVKVLSNNIVYTWEGASIGNSSSAQTGSTVHRVYSYLSDIVVNGTSAVYVSGYSERLPSVFAFNTGNIQQKINIFKPGTSTPGVTTVTTDGINNYYGCVDANSSNVSFVMATRVSDNAEVIFSSVNNYSLAAFGDTYNVIGKSTTTNSTITSVAVQAGNNYLYLSRPRLNQIAVLNKNTGALITTITTFNNPKSVAFDKAGHLWVSSGINTIARYTVNNDGSLTSDGINITAVSDPGKIDVSYDSKTVGVIDYSTEQLKTFSNSTGASIDVIGQPGGYTKNSVAANDKFCLKTASEGNLAAGYSFNRDGSIWLADSGDNRFLHLSSSGAFIESIYIQPTPYYTNVDSGNPTRVTGGFLEFSVDYSQTLSGSKGWAFANNWGAVISNTYDINAKFKFIKTFPNGHTYAFIRKVNEWELVELIPNGVLRLSGKMYGGTSFVDDDNNLVSGLNRYSLTGYDGSNNPVWGNTAELLADFSSLKGTDASEVVSGFNAQRNFVTTDNKAVIFNPGVGKGGDFFHNGYVTSPHLGAMTKGGNKFLWQTAASTTQQYSGNIPKPDYFDIGNGVNNNAGSNVTILGNVIIAGYHGENWKQGQTNYYNVYYSDGLSLGQFGTAQAVYDATEAKEGMAGNALSPQLVQGANSDIAYLYHGDETFHGGIHRWKLTGLNTVNEQTINIVYDPASIDHQVIAGVDLLADLPFNTELSSGLTGRWKLLLSRAATAATNKLSYLKNDLDLVLNCASSDTSPSGFYPAYCDLGSNTGLNKWKIIGQLIYKGNAIDAGEMKQYLDVLDNSGNIIARLTDTFKYVDNNGNNAIVIYANGSVLFSGTQNTLNSILYSYQPLEISANGAAITIKLAGFSVTTSKYDTKADVSSPSILRPAFQGGYNPVGRSFDFKQLRFIAKSQSITFNSITSKGLGALPFNLNATSTSNLPIIYTVLSGPAKVIKNIVTLTGAGTVVIEASQPGNETYDAATPVRQTFIVNPIRVDL